MMLKLTMIGAVLAAGLIGAGSQAKAELVRVNVHPAAVTSVRTAPRPDAWRHRRYEGRLDATPARNHGYRPVAVVGQNPAVVAAEVRAQVQQATRDVRSDVRRGVVERRALASLEIDRREVERDLHAASLKGYITVQDRVHLDQQVQKIRDLRSQFLCAQPAPVTYRR